MTLELPAIDTRSEVRWTSPASGLWVASRRGEHAGRVERLDGRYHARSARDRALGSFEDLDSALAVIDGGVDDPEGAPRGVRAVLWAIVGGAAATAFALALALIR